MEILEDWGRKYDVLLSCRALEEGLDVKEVAVAIIDHERNESEAVHSENRKDNQAQGGKGREILYSILSRNGRGVLCEDG